VSFDASSGTLHPIRSKRARYWTADGVAAGLVVQVEHADVAKDALEIVDDSGEFRKTLTVSASVLGRGGLLAQSKALHASGEVDTQALTLLAVRGSSRTPGP
jgi:hypothetical protein